MLGLTLILCQVSRRRRGGWGGGGGEEGRWPVPISLVSRYVRHQTSFSLGQIPPHTHFLFVSRFRGDFLQGPPAGSVQGCLPGTGGQVGGPTPGT